MFSFYNKCIYEGCLYKYFLLLGTTLWNQSIFSISTDINSAFSSYIICIELENGQNLWAGLTLNGYTGLSGWKCRLLFPIVLGNCEQFFHFLLLILGLHSVRHSLAPCPAAWLKYRGTCRWQNRKQSLIRHYLHEI